jgi:hypothetical protein
VRALVAACVLVACAATAAAEEARERIAVASFKLLGDELSDAARREQMRISLQGGLAGGFDVVPTADVDRAIAAAPTIAGCDTTACLGRLAELLGVRRVVRAQLEVVGQSNWTLWLELVDPRTGQIVGRVEDLCDVCNVSEASEKLSNAAARLRGKCGTLIVTTTPPKPVPRTWRYLGIAGVAVGGVALIGGIAAIALHGSRAGQHIAPNGDLIIDSYDTLGAGVAFTLIGAALVGGGVWAIWHDRKLHQQLALAPVVTPTRAGLVLGFRF